MEKDTGWCTLSFHFPHHTVEIIDHSWTLILTVITLQDTWCINFAAIYFSELYARKNASFEINLVAPTRRIISPMKWPLSTKFRVFLRGLELLDKTSGVSNSQNFKISLQSFDIGDPLIRTFPAVPAWQSQTRWLVQVQNFSHIENGSIFLFLAFLWLFSSTISRQAWHHFHMLHFPFII